MAIITVNIEVPGEKPVEIELPDSVPVRLIIPKLRKVISNLPNPAALCLMLPDNMSLAESGIEDGDTLTAVEWDFYVGVK